MHRQDFTKLKTPQYELSEEPLYALQKKLEMNGELYVLNYSRKPILRLMGIPGILETHENVDKVLF